MSVIVTAYDWWVPADKVYNISVAKAAAARAFAKKGCDLSTMKAHHYRHSVDGVCYVWSCKEKTT